MCNCCRYLTFTQSVTSKTGSLRIKSQTKTAVVSGGSLKQLKGSSSLGKSSSSSKLRPSLNDLFKVPALLTENMPTTETTSVEVHQALTQNSEEANVTTTVARRHSSADTTTKPTFTSSTTTTKIPAPKTATKSLLAAPKVTNSKATKPVVGSKGPV